MSALAAPARTFVDSPAVRAATPLLVGLIGPSGTGKTCSALRLATGFQRVSGGEIYFIDTESNRALHYAPQKDGPQAPRVFNFRHVPFGAPFSPLDYLAAIEHCHDKGAKNIVIDSMSHEHEGPGGVLEMHESELARLAKDDEKKRERVGMLAWQKPKSERRRLINTILQMPANFIFCFRSKEKMLIKKGEDPRSLGFMPIAGDEFVYEMTLKLLLLPSADGRPTLVTDNPGEKLMVKVPGQFRVPPFTELIKPDAQISEDLGEALARWAAGSPAKGPVDVADLLKRYGACSDPATHRALNATTRSAWASLAGAERKALTAAADAAAARIKASDEGKGKARAREPGVD